MKPIDAVYSVDVVRVDVSYIRVDIILVGIVVINSSTLICYAEEKGVENLAIRMRIVRLPFSEAFLQFPKLRTFIMMIRYG